MAPTSTSADPVISLVERLMPYSSGGKDGPPPHAWSWTLLQLLALLESYPGGITEVLAQTHMHTQSLTANKSKQESIVGPPTLEQLLATAKGRQDVIGSVSVCIASVSEPAASLKVSSAPATEGVSAYMKGVTTTVSKDDAPQSRESTTSTLMLRDGSLGNDQASVGMLLHSQLQHLVTCTPPVLEPGRKLRLSGVQLRRPSKRSKRSPWLLPTPHVAVLVPDLAAAAALFPGQGTYILSQVIKHVDLEAEQFMVLEGLLGARVVSPQEAAACGQCPADSPDACTMWVRDPGSAQTQTCAQLRLLPGQEDFLHLLQEQEEFVVSCPTVRGLDATTCCFQLGPDSVICIVGSASKGESPQIGAQEGKELESRRTLTSDVKFGATPAVVIGRVVSLSFLPIGGRHALDLVLQDQGGTLRVRLFFRAMPNQAALALRVGHTAVVAGILPAPATAADGNCNDSDRGTDVLHSTATWHEGEYGGQLTSLSALQSALTSAMLQTSPLTLATAQRLCNGGPDSLQTLMLSFAEIAAAPKLRWKMVHSACGRQISQTLLPSPQVRLTQDGNEKYECCGASRVTTASQQHLPEQLQDRTLHKQWQCHFCSAACCKNSTHMAASAHVQLKDTTVTTGVDVDEAGPLLLVSPSEFHSWSKSKKASALQALVESKVVMVLYPQTPESRDGESGTDHSKDSLPYDPAAVPMACSLIRLL